MIKDSDDDFIPPDIFGPAASAPRAATDVAASPDDGDFVPAEIFTKRPAGDRPRSATAAPPPDDADVAARPPVDADTAKPSMTTSSARSLWANLPPLPRLNFSAGSSAAPAAPDTALDGRPFIPPVAAPVDGPPVVAPSMLASSVAEAAIAPPAAAPIVASPEVPSAFDLPRFDPAPAPGAAAALPQEPAALRQLDTLLLRMVARSGSTLYLSSGARPSVRVDGELETIDDVAPLSGTDVEAIVVSLMLTRPDARRALGADGGSDWIAERPRIGRVRCMPFEDHHGPGAVFRLVPVSAATPEQLALSGDVQALVGEPDGLIVIAGRRSSGKRTTLSGLLDLISRSRRAHAIAIELSTDAGSQSDNALISRRRVRGGLAAMLDAARGALDENPDILMLQEIRSEPLMTLALDAAASGHLVIGGLTVPAPAAALDEMVNLYAADQQGQALRRMAQHLRALIGQVLVPKVGGGRVVAREVILNTPALANVLNHGRIGQLRTAIDASRQRGTVPLTDALAELVKKGVVQSSDAYRYVSDVAALRERLTQP